MWVMALQKVFPSRETTLLDGMRSMYAGTAASPLEMQKAADNRT